ncbi:hypothetical protein HanIR_Chr12g0574041 [Helianthus annuus]|nr:hypothetical protein HanIR_Chr12g0574041 [Helianthus annuus]
MTHKGEELRNYTLQNSTPAKVCFIYFSCCVLGPKYSFPKVFCHLGCFSLQ